MGVSRSFPQTANGVGYDTLTTRWSVLFLLPTMIHRVVQPPHDQGTYDRLGVFYFSMANDNVRLLPLSHSPVLQRVGIERRCPDEEAPLAEAWRKERTISYGRVALKKGSENNTEEEVIEGIVVKHYN